VQYIERSYRMRLSLTTVARHVGVHPATLAAAFRRYHHRSVGEWIRDLRLRYAHDALITSRRPIKEIAVEAGFYDQAHFGRHFKIRFGVSPASVRSRA
jgi:AraC family transcriptional regulator